MGTIDPSLLIPYFKRVGQTPYDCVEAYKTRFPSSRFDTVSYAGRLDPMASGVLLLLRGEANKKRRHFEHLSKEYEVRVLCGLTTDTGDLMGKQLHFQFPILKSQRGTQVQKQLKKVIHSFVGSIEQRYPIYSSMRVQGKPLYWWARQGKISEVEIPSHEVHISSIMVKKSRRIHSHTLLNYIVRAVRSVQGDFRQKDIIQNWKNILQNNKSFTSFPLVHLTVLCGSGVYIRQLVQDIGEMIHTPMCVYSIHRTKVGDYTVDDCVNFTDHKHQRLFEPIR